MGAVIDAEMDLFHETAAIGWNEDKSGQVPITGESQNTVEAGNKIQHNRHHIKHVL